MQTVVRRPLKSKTTSKLLNNFGTTSQEKNKKIKTTSQEKNQPYKNKPKIDYGGCGEWKKKRKT